MGCFESYMEFRDEVEKIKTNQRDQLRPSEKEKGNPSADPPNGL
jgi:hypothetical protein